MAITFKDRKTEYVIMVAKKSEELFSKWQAEGISSREICLIAKEYSYHKLITSNFAIRFKAQIFVGALEKRLSVKYKNFFVRLFLSVNRKRELHALSFLKKMLGFNADTQYRKILEVEMEKLAIAVSNKPEDEDDTEGGRNARLDDFVIEEELNAFLESEEKSAQESGSLPTDEPTEDADTIDGITEIPQGPKDLSGEPSSKDQTKEVSVDKASKSSPKEEVSKDAKPSEQKTAKESNSTQTEKASTQKQATTTNNTVADNVGLGEVKREDAPSPFPVFKGNEQTQQSLNNSNKDANLKGQDKPINLKSTEEKTPISVEGEKPKVISEAERFGPDKIHPVFHRRGGEEPRTVETKAVEVNQPKPVEKVVKEYISEENLARREVNVTMSRDQLNAYISQLKENAQIILDAHDEHWREQISVNLDGNQKNEMVQANPNPNANNVGKGPVNINK